MADSRIPADVNHAVYTLVKDFGADKLSRLTGTPEGTIHNKANPHETSHHKPTLSDIIIWTNLSGDVRIPSAISRSCGGVHVDLRGMEHQSDEALLDLILAQDREEGEAASAIQRALDDGRVSQLAFDLIRGEELEAVAARLTVLQRLQGMIR